MDKMKIGFLLIMLFVTTAVLLTGIGLLRETQRITTAVTISLSLETMPEAREIYANIARELSTPYPVEKILDAEAIAKYPEIAKKVEKLFHEMYFKGILMGFYLQEGIITDSRVTLEEMEELQILVRDFRRGYEKFHKLLKETGYSITWHESCFGSSVCDIRFAVDMYFGQNLEKYLPEVEIGDIQGRIALVQETFSHLAGKRREIKIEGLE